MACSSSDDSSSSNTTTTGTSTSTSQAAGTLALSASTFTVAEAAGSLSISVNRTAGSSGAVSVHYATAAGTAAAGTNYTSSSGALNWADGDTAPKTLAIAISNAAPFSGTKTFTLALSSPTASAVLGASSATISIDGSAAAATPGSLALSASAYSVGQDAGSLTISIARSGGTSGAVSVKYATSNATAVAGTDYTAASGTLNWAAADAAAKTLTVVISNAAPFSGNKTFNVALSAVAGGATLGATSAAVVTIDGAAVTTAAPTAAFSTHILVDQFGYRPNDPKVAVIRTPHVGYDAADTFTPGKTYELHSAADNSLVVSAAPAVWNGGATESDSGDSGWWFDFSTVTTPGSYYVLDTSNNARSAVFPIGQTVYKNILKAAMRMYYYQRASLAKVAPYADKCWLDSAAYVGANQDTQAHDIADPNNAAKVRDVSGGWFDAGDTNKYVTFAMVPVHQLLTAYQENPTVFTDDFNIPESGNGVPDVLDEVKWETDWLKKMQNSDGSVALKVGDIVYTGASPPSSDKSARYYIESCTSATIATAGMFAHAAYVFNGVAGLQAEAASLKGMAIAAWNNYQGIATKQTNCDNGTIKAGIADWDLPTQNQDAVVAAVYLFAITGSSTYNSYVEANYTLLRPYHDIGWMRYQAEQGEALLFYTTLSNADPTLKSSILASKLSDVQNSTTIYGFSATQDLYRNYLADYIWGSNQVRSNYGNTNAEVATYSIPVANASTYQTRALDTLHYFHGVNPFAMAYLSNMYVDGYGATFSANEIFHTWYAAGSIWSDAKTSSCGPAPGYLPGGPNLSAGSDGIPASEVPPVGQPAQKSFKAWNGEDASWVVSEPGIYYQSAYVELLSHFAK